jgi:hypothetical protein
MVARLGCALILLASLSWCADAAAPPEAIPLPHAPSAKIALPPVYLGGDLACVPEVALEALLRSTERRNQQKITHTIASKLDARQQDGFVMALRKERFDLAGLPFRLGNTGRISNKRCIGLSDAADRVREACSERGQLAELRRTYRLHYTSDDEEQSESSAVRQEYWAAALNQVLCVQREQSQEHRANLLAGIPLDSASRELSRLAVFSEDEDARTAAIEALAVRSRRDATEVLVEALRYPWLAVAQNAADAIVKLKRTDLLPQLVEVLDRPDPRVPGKETFNGRESQVVRELVRINHFRNCLLCHATGGQGEKGYSAEVPLLFETLSLSTNGYSSRREEERSHLFVRFDVTYLRQDFSILLPVKDNDPGPRKQRFDFLVRKRVLSDSEANDLSKRLTPREGELSPYHRAALKALRELTGRDAGTKADDWRKLLKLPAKSDG